MVEHRSQFRLYDVDNEGLDEGLIECQRRPYRFGRSADDCAPDRSVPHFFSDGESDPEQFLAALRESRAALVSSKTLMAVAAALSIAVLFAFLSCDPAREMAVNAMSSIAVAVRSPSANPSTAQLTASELKFARMSAPGSQAAKTAPAVVPAPATMVASITPSREDIFNAYQSALQAAAAAAAAAPARRIDGGELVTLVKRAKDLLAMDDIPSARLLLERAAEAQNASAALMLARTYDAEVIGSADVRDITPEPAKARAWYQKAADLGSAEAQRRLAQLPK